MMNKDFFIFLVLISAPMAFLIGASYAQSCTAQAGFASPCINNAPVLALSSPVVSGSNVNFAVNVNMPQSTNAIYATGYYWSAAQNQWIPFTLTGTAYPGTDGSTWLTNSASKTLSIPTSAAVNNVIYVVTWDYIFSNNAWSGPSCSNAAGCWRLTTLTVPSPGADTTPPSVSVSHSPTSNIQTSTSVTITATATDNVGVSNIEIFADGLLKKTCTSTTTCSYAASYAAGTHTYYATAKDAANNQGRDPIGTSTKSFTVGSVPPPPGITPAFLGAMGSGATTKGGRGGALCEVTTLADSGSGSLRDCLTRSGPRTVVFRVGGTIQLQTGIRVTNPFVTIAGQTAPGGGIALSGKQSCENVLYIYTHDVIVRYLRLRAGSNNACRPPGAQSGAVIFLGNADVYNVVVDHTSVSWTTDDTVSPWANTGQNHDQTFQFMMIGEALAGHATCFISGNQAGTAELQTNIDLHHNFFSGCSHRIPLAKHKSMRFVNNIIYDWSFYASQALGGISADFISNLYKAGPLDPGLGTHELQFSEVDSGDGPVGTPSVYLSGNIGPHNSNPSADNWVMAARVTGENGAETGPVPSNFRRFSPMSAAAVPISVNPVTLLESILLSDVGASQRLDCSGNWISNRDAVDTRLISEYQSGTGGIINNENDVGGFPTLASGTPCADSDRDGMPDAWEQQHFGTTSRGSATDSSSDFDGDGYTDLEEFLNGTDPKV